jgi:hypothetical protein
MSTTRCSTCFGARANIVWTIRACPCAPAISSRRPPARKRTRSSTPRRRSCASLRSRRSARSTWLSIRFREDGRGGRHQERGPHDRHLQGVGAGDACGLFRGRGKDAVNCQLRLWGSRRPYDGSVSSRSLEQAQLCQRSHAIVQADLLGDLAFPHAQHRSARKVHLPASCGRQ